MADQLLDRPHFWDYSMKRKISGFIVGLALFGPLPAFATTYDYTGPAYTTFEGSTPPTELGSLMTGTVTFNFNTAGYTGTFLEAQA
jgi:hypothetical protein